MQLIGRTHASLPAMCLKIIPRNAAGTMCGDQTGASCIQGIQGKYCLPGPYTFFIICIYFKNKFSVCAQYSNV